RTRRRGPEDRAPQRVKVFPKTKPPRLRGALFLLLAVSLPASALDPRFVWETIDTPHFEIHYHQGMYAYAQKVARAAELAHPRLVTLLEHEQDERNRIVDADDTAFATGNAPPRIYPI